MSSHPRRFSSSIVWLLSTVWLLPSPSLAAAQPKHPHLGGYPLCEASAALLVACPAGPASTCLLVGDNEVRDRLFVLPFDGCRLDARNRSEIDIGVLLPDDGELSDIEAITRLASGEIVVYGSHSRNSGCERKKKRRRYLGLRLDDGTAAAGEVGLAERSKSFDLADAFPADAIGTLGAVRAAVAAAQEEADRASEDPGVACTPQAFNLEGAVALPSGAGDELWIGLRAPTVDGKAALIRQTAGLGSFSFDRARLVDLGGRGIRELTYARGWIWGLAGPPEDSSAEFRLWRFRANLLEADDQIAVEELATVPSSSEGLAIWGNTALVLIDGGELGEDDSVVIGGEEVTEICARDAAYLTVAVPW